MDAATPLGPLRGLRSLAGDTVVYGASIAALPVALLLATPALTRRLGTGGFGLVDVLAGIAGFTAIAAMLGMDSAITRTYFEGNANRAASARAAAVLAVFVSCIAAALAFGTWTIVVGSDLQAAALAFVAIPLTNSLTLTRLALLLPRRRRRYLVTAVATAGAAVSAAVLGVLLGGGPAGYFGGFGLGVAAGLALTLVATGGVAATERSLDFSALRRFLTYGVPLVPATAAVWMLFAVDRALVAALRSYDEAGLYGLGAKITSPIMLATSAFAVAWSPFILSQRVERHAQIRARALTAVAAAAGAVMLVLVLFAPALVSVLAPPSFEAAVRAVPGVALGWLFWAVATVLATEFSVTRRTHVIATATIAAAAANIALNMVFVPQYGFVAAAWITALAFAMLAGVYLVWERQTVQTPYRFRRLGLIASILVAGHGGVFLPWDRLGILARAATALVAVALLARVAITDREVAEAIYDPAS